MAENWYGLAGEWEGAQGWLPIHWQAQGRGPRVSTLTDARSSTVDTQQDLGKKWALKQGLNLCFYPSFVTDLDYSN